MPQIKKRKGKVIVMGSISHSFSRADINDVDFSENDDIVLVCDYFVSKKGNMKNDPYGKSY